MTGGFKYEYGTCMVRPHRLLGDSMCTEKAGHIMSTSSTLRNGFPEAPSLERHWAPYTKAANLQLLINSIGDIAELCRVRAILGA